MVERADLRDLFNSLLEPRGLTHPDGRPLYAYRFSRDEFERVADLLTRYGRLAVHDPFGAALVVSHIAEWYRRERTGGHWDWIRPLRSIGYHYGANARIQYSDIEDLVSDALRVWRRPGPRGGERLLAIVREAGFPVASVREDPRISSWLKNSVLCAEKGFSAPEAVRLEAWRVSDRLARALLEPATELCSKIIELRTCLPRTERQGDPVDYLDRNRPAWRDELPFDVEGEDIRSMVEQIVRARQEDSAAALDVTRYLIRKNGAWVARASLSLSGRIDLQRFPPLVASTLADGRRVRIFPHPPFCEELVAVAAIEPFEGEDGLSYDARPLVAKFDAPLALEEEARIVAQAGSKTLAEYIATGGEALHEPVIALEIGSLDEDSVPVSLRILGSSSIRTNHPDLGLAVRDEYFDAVTFSDGFTELGRCGSRRIVRFCGTATLTLVGARLVWRTATERKVQGRPILVGNLVPNVREAVFCGVPKIWIDRDGLLSAPARQTVHWRPRGRGSWRPIEGGKPWGNVDLAIIEKGELLASIGAAIVAPTFEINIDRRSRELHIYGLGTRLLVAKGATQFGVHFADEAGIVQLGQASNTATIELHLRWDAELSLTFADPSHDLRLIDANDAIVKPRSIISVDSLKGLRILASREVPLHMELRASDVQRLTTTRSILGEVPLSAFTESITQLLGSSESLDACVRLYSSASAEHIADVRWYAEEIDPFDAAPQGPFAALATTHGLDLHAISLSQPLAGVAAVAAPASQTTMRSHLKQTLASGPWLIYGHRKQGGAKIRPRALPAETSETGEATAMARAMSVSSLALRLAAFAQLYSQPRNVTPNERRTILDLLATSRSEKLPISSIDALRALARAPALATHLLASCDSLDERAALLDLQRDLPFFWCSTTVNEWVDAFSSRIDHIRERLCGTGISESIAYRNVVTALADIVSLRPELAGHAKSVFLIKIAPEMTRQGEIVDGRAVHNIQVRAQDARVHIHRFIHRHDDLPPQDFLSPQTKMAQRSRSAPYDPRLADVIAAPFALADHASGRATLDELEIRRCREAWLYDSEYFEAIVPLGIDEALRAFARTG